MHETDVHSVTVVTEDTYLIFVYKIAAMATDKPTTEAGLNRFRGTAQHVVA